MKLSDELNEKFSGLLSFSPFRDKFAILNKFGDFEYSEIKVYVAKFENGTYKVFDGGNTVNYCYQIFNVSSKEFLDKFKQTLVDKKVSKQDDVCYIDCVEDKLFETVRKLYNFQKEVFKI